MKRNRRAGTELAVNGVMALASLTSTLALSQDFAATSDQRAAQINQASLTSVEQSYLNIPRLCKARSAAFDPILVGRETVSASILAVHAALDLAAEVTA